MTNQNLLSNTHYSILIGLLLFGLWQVNWYFWKKMNIKIEGLVQGSTGSTWRVCLLLALMLMQAGCLQNPLRSQSRPVPIIDPSQSDKSVVVTSDQQRTSNPQAVPQKIAEPVEIQAGSGKYLGQEHYYKAKNVTTDAEGISLNFKDMDLQEFVKAVLGEVLKQNYVIDPTVAGKVTIQTVKPLPEDQLLGVMQEVLSLNGAAMILVEGRYRILPATKAAQSALVPRVRRLKGLGYGLQIVPLHYIGAAEMAEILKPMLQAQGIIHTDKRRNLLILSGSEEQITSLMETINIFDVDWLAGKSVTLFPLKKVEPKALVTDLEAALEGKGGELFDGMVRLIPIERVNGLLVVSSTPEYMRELKGWIERLDVANDKAEKRLYVYHLKNAKAADIAGILSSIFSGSSSRRQQQKPSASVVPTEQAVTLESSDPTEQSNDQTLATAMQQVVTPGSDSGVTLFGENSVRIIADEVNNALVILGTAREYDMVESAIRKLDILPKQVLIEATIVEVTLSGDLRYGVEWFFKNGGFGSGKHAEGRLSLSNTAKDATGFSYSIIDGITDVRVVLNALESESNVRILSTPSLMVLDNKTAKINVGDEVPIPIRQSSSNTDALAPTVNEIQYRNTGVILTVTPRINAGGLVTLEVIQEVSNVSVEKVSGIDAPIIAERSIESTVAIQSGESVVLGGLIKDQTSDNKSGLPGLSRIPILGSLFSETTSNDDRTELLVILTPQVITNSAEAREITEEYRKKLARPIKF